MSSRRKRAAAALAVLVVGATATGSAYAAFGATTSPPAATFSGAPDWTPPALSATTVQKGGTTTPGWFGGYVKPGGQYYVYSQVAADMGSPASGIAAPTANLSNLTSGQTAAAFTAGTYGSQGATYNYRGGPFTVSAAAGSRTYTVTTKDVAGNTLTSAAQTVTVDGTAPTGSDVQTARSGGTAAKAETGDSLTLTFSEPIDPASMITGWDGTSRNVTFRIVNGSGSASDAVQLLNGATPLTALGTITLPAKDYVKSTVDFTSSPMVLSGSTLTVTLGSTTGAANVTAGTAGTTTWSPGTALYDRAGNNLTSTTPLNETGGSDAEF
jgi:hypothetical protein